MSAVLPVPDQTWDRPAAGVTPPPCRSALAAARVRRRLGLEQAAACAGLEPEDARALEEGRLSRFASPEAALAAAVVYATALGVRGPEARRLAGLPARRRVLSVPMLRRLIALVAFTVAAGTLLWSTAPPRVLRHAPAPAPPPAPVAKPRPAALPAPWQIRVDVYNGTATDGAAARLANEVAGLAYRVGAVTNATRPDYPETRVYFPPGGMAIAERLAEQLGVGTMPLPGGNDPRRLVVIVGAR
jgi:hypothetical protein